MWILFLNKFKKPILCFQAEFFFLVFFSVCFLCVHFFTFTLLFIIRATKEQSTHINKASNINKIIYYNYGIISESRHEAILESLFPLLTYKIIFASLRYLYSHKTQNFLWWCWMIWLSATLCSENLTGLICAFS